jgi:hypothetical protein
MEKRREVLPSFFCIFFIEQENLSYSIKTFRGYTLAHNEHSALLTTLGARMFQGTLGAVNRNILSGVKVSEMAFLTILAGIKVTFMITKWADLIRLSFAGRSLFTEF